MNRQDLIAFSRDGLRRRQRMALAAVAFALAWMAVLVWQGEAVLDRLGPAVFVALAAVPVIAIVGTAVRGIAAMPKCPHCGIRLTGWLLAIAVASGNCGHCGRRVED